MPRGFQKGHIGYKGQLGKIFTEEHRRKISEAKKGKKRSKKFIENLRIYRTGKKLSEETKQKISESNKGEKNYSWKGKKGSYSTFHQWLRRIYGLAKQCEKCGVLAENYKNKKGLSASTHPIHYALIHGKEHDHKRENYICLCYRCHKLYDNSNFE